ncbi:MAG: D-amino acid dehydrogenase [Pseudomonadota bacterium]|nr:D-amino acid dehydrogenase [Pseudomonadota bacterium]MDE3037177.1 D-amino acid dehydrogenase [Pseudomonadota bacterium]
MKIIILGSGLLGVTTAYELGRRGHEVTVIERQPGCGMETSYANGGQLSYSHAEPWAGPSVLPKLPQWFFRNDAPLVFRPRADWQMIKWGLQFLRNCTGARARGNCVNLLRLGLYSRRQMTRIREETGITFDYAAKGVLHIFSTEKDFDRAKRQLEFQAKFGCEERVLSRQEALALEPALSHTSRAIVGGIHSVLDESGDAWMFCTALAKVAAERHGVKFRYGVLVNRLRTDGNAISAVVTDQDDLTADAYVMALGSYSPLHLRPIKINLPIYPMKGYSITTEAGDACPQVSITDGTHKIVYSRLGSRLRVAGTAEFAGYSQRINDRRIAPILRAAKELFPKANWNAEIKSWACLRPSTPDGPPIIGATPYSNLFLNTGHGTLGWTQAAGSATLVSDLIDRTLPGISLSGLTMERYA